MNTRGRHAALPDAQPPIMISSGIAGLPEQAQA
jgi:hypothetical protein